MALEIDNGGDRPWKYWRLARWGAAGVLLLLPLVAMQFTDEVRWNLTDFVVFGAMLGAAIGAYELAVKIATGHTYRAAAGVALMAAFLLIWVNLAVGLLPDETNPANWMYGGVLAVGIIAALLVRFRPQGMALAMLATALAQALVAVIALITESQTQGTDSFKILASNGIFVALFVGSALLFRKAAREEPPGLA